MHACLYGLAHAVIVALGCAPGLGFVHVGHECSFVYDIADLYKAEVTIPIAFEVAAQAPEDLPAVVRRRVRDAMVEHHILERMVHDIRWLLLTEEEQLFPAYAGVTSRASGAWCSCRGGCRRTGKPRRMKNQVVQIRWKKFMQDSILQYMKFCIIINLQAICLL